MTLLSKFTTGLGLLASLGTFIAGAAHAAPRASEARAASENKAMLLKYLARCALTADQSLESADPDGGAPRHFPGGLGLAPEWRDGTCDSGCQQKISSCLIALTNRTGKHVEVSVLSGSSSFGAAFRPGADDIPFPHQEGAFFGNLFTGEAFACRGRDVDKAPQVKRFCAIAPETCSGLAIYQDAGRCEDVCEQECRTLPDGTERCAAKSCRTPDGRVWRLPITTYVRNRIEAGNADRISGVTRQDEELHDLSQGASARFDLVDFGRPRALVSTLALQIVGRGTGRIEAWLDGKRRLGTLRVRDTAGVLQEQRAPLATKGISGRHALVLKIASGRNLGRLSTVELR